MSTPDYARIASSIPTLDSLVVFSTADGLLAGHWSRTPGATHELAAAYWSSMLESSTRAFAAVGLKPAPGWLVLHSSSRTVALAVLDHRLALVLTFSARMSADWSEHYLRRASLEAMRLLHIEAT